MDTNDEKNRALRTAIALIRMMDEDEIAKVEEEVISRMQVLGCESDLASRRERMANPPVMKPGKWGSKNRYGPWEKRVEGIDEEALANGLGFRSLKGAFLKRGESNQGCVLRRLATGDYVAEKDGVELASTTSGEEAGFTGPLSGVNTHVHAKVLWALWKELRS